MLGCNDNVFQSYPCRQSQRNKKCQKCLIICSNLVEKLSNLSEAQGTKRLPKFLTSNTCTCIYILNVRVCIQLHGYYILKPTLCLQYCMQKCIESLRLKDLRYWGLKKTYSWDFKFTLICYFKILKFSCMWCNDEQLVKILILEHQSSNNQGLAVAMILATAWHLMALCILDLGDTEMVCFLHVDAGRCCLW